MDAHYTFTGPEFSTQLAPSDQVAVYNYSPRILVFRLNESSNQEDIVSILREGIQELVNVGLRYHDKGEAHLKIKDLSTKYGLEDLREIHFSQEKLLPEDLCPTLGWEHPAMRPLELFSVQANFIKGGLLLVLSIYHSICDGTGQYFVTEMLAKQCRAIGQRKHGASVPDRKLTFSLHQFDRSRLWEGSSGKANVSKLSSYTVLPEPPRGLPAWALPSGKPLASETFLIEKSALTKLKDLASGQKPSSSSEPFISTHDAVCALLWRTAMAARVKAGIISSSDRSTFGMVVDGRAQFSPPLPADFLGNAVLGFKVEDSVKDLAAPEGLGAAAFEIRRGVKSIDDAAIRNYITMIKEVPDVGQIYIDCLEPIKTTGLFLTSWAKFDYASLNWGDAFGECEAFRFPAGGYMDGVAVMFPPLKNGDWELTPTLEASTMKAFKEDKLWQKFARTA